MICASTLLVKQHVVLDVVTGMPLAVVSWWVSLLIWRIVDKTKHNKLPEGGN